jgi:hypothetical protein
MLERLQRRAILYVRQSSTYQVHNDLKSQKLQYAMQERLRHLGWCVRMKISVAPLPGSWREAASSVWLQRFAWERSA